MSVSETVKSYTVIESDKPMRYNALSRMAEGRRVRGELSFSGVEDVYIWCDKIYIDGKLVKE